MNFDKCMDYLKSKEECFNRNLNSYATILLEECSIDINSLINNRASLWYSINKVFGLSYWMIQRQNKGHFTAIEVDDFIHPKDWDTRGIIGNKYSEQVDYILQICSYNLRKAFNMEDHPVFYVHEIHAIMAKILEVAKKYGGMEAEEE